MHIRGVHKDVFKEDLQKTQSETNVSKLFKAAAIMSILAFLTGAFNEVGQLCSCLSTEFASHV